MADARDLLRQWLSDKGLLDEEAWAYEQLIEGRSPEAVKLDLEQRPTFQARYPGFTQMQREGRAISVDQWLAYEATARQFARQAGLPAELFTNARIAAYITNDISVAELAQRTQDAEQAVYEGYDVEGARLYGVTAGDFVAALLAPDVAAPVVERKLRAAQAGTFAQRTGYGTLAVNEAERIVGSGVDPSQFGERLGALATQEQVFRPFDAGEETIDRDTQIAAGFEGNAAAREKIRRQARRRSAVFEQGGGYVAGQRGYSGIG